MPSITSQPIRIRARARNGVAEVTILMPHPMETGLRQDESGQAVPAHFITHMSVTVAERAVFSASMGIAVARDPLLNFRFSGAISGQRLVVTWIDNLGQARTDEAVIA
jgi:sulfur-oxidizing protein SoxZ